MKQNDSKNRTDFFAEIGIALRRDGYDTSVPDNGLLPVSADGLPLCRISETGSIQELASSDNSPNDRLDQIQRVISEREQSGFQYDDSIVRQMIECIKVYPSGKLDIIFGGGYIVEENITAE